MMCDWDTAKWLIFSNNGEPFIYYSHLTSIAIFLGLLGFTFLRLKQWPKQSFRLMALSYVTWLFCDLVLWANEGIENVLFFWTIINLVEPLIFVFAYSYFSQFTEGKEFSVKTKWVIFVLLLPTLLMAPIGLSVVGFDYTNCDRNVVEGIAAYYNYLLEALFLLLIIYRTAKQLIYKTYRGSRGKLLLVFGGTALLCFSFLVANFLGTLTDDYTTSQYGHIAVPIFATFLAYITIKYESFEPRILLIDILVAGLFILLLSLFFVPNENYQVYANIMAFILFIPLGYTLLTGIRKEVKTRKQVEMLATNLETANKRLKELDQLKSEFLSVAAHQLRAPLTAIRGYTSLIEEGNFGATPETMKEPLARIIDSARNMANSIEDYLDVSRIEQGRMKFESSKFDLTDLAQKVVDELGPVATRRKLTLSMQPAGEIFVTADIGKIKQVMTNLVDNAIKYTQAGSVTISVEKKDSVARLMVSDTGIGIPAEEIPNLFDKFTRARDANKVNTTGTGLGLYVARKLIEGHKGKVWVESDGTNKGSRFIFEIPAIS